MEQSRRRRRLGGEIVGRRLIVGHLGAVAVGALGSVLACAYALRWERSIELSTAPSRAGPLSLAISGVVISVLLAALLIVYTDRVRVAEIYAHQALHDPLTGLPNRALLIDRCTQMLALAKRHKGIVAAFYIDLDAFKRVNVTYGHEGGDAVLVAVGERLLATVRPSDTVARIGGDEYVVLCDGLNTTEEAELLVGRIEQALAEPISYLGEALTVRASIGTAIAEPNQLPEELLHHADTAMHEAKSAPRS